MKGEMNEIAVRNGAKGLKISSFYVINYEILGGAFSHPCMPPPPPGGGGGVVCPFQLILKYVINKFDGGVGRGGKIYTPVCIWRYRIEMAEIKNWIIILQWKVVHIWKRMHVGIEEMF